MISPVVSASEQILHCPGDLGLWVSQAKGLIEAQELEGAHRLIEAFNICCPGEIWPHILRTWLAVEKGSPRSALAEADLAMGSRLYQELGEGEKGFLQALRTRSESALRAKELKPEAALLSNSESDQKDYSSLSDEFITVRQDIKVKKIAFYLPQFHPIPENDDWWGEGFTEWNNVSRAKPFFSGHWQPRRPGPMGFYDLRVPSTMNKQFEIAQQYGIDGFCFYYYWFDGKKLLEKPLEMLMSGQTNPFPFCICWVNETWTRSWDGMSGEVLIEANQTLEGTKAFIRDIEPILKNENYIRIDGKPVLLVYCPHKLEDPVETVRDWRQFALKSGIGELHLCAVQSFAFDDPLPLGFDAAVEFPPHCVWNKYEGLTYCKDLTDEDKESLNTDPEFTGVLRDYGFFAECAMNRPQEPYLLYRSCMLAWDNTARRMENSHVYVNFTINLYRQWLATIIDKSYRDPLNTYGESLVFINAWNEWAEGCTLEPDQHFGHALLRATQTAAAQAEWLEPSTSYKHGLPLGVTLSCDHYNLIVIGHDAHPFGAQINLLSMVKNLTKKMKNKVHVLLIEGGPLADNYRKLAPTTIVSEDLENNPEQVERLFRGLIARGYDKAILNTTVSGRFTKLLRSMGVGVTNLIHELPSLIKSYQLEEVLYELIAESDDVVFSTDYVRKKIEIEFGLELSASRVLPQGINFNPEYKHKRSVRSKLRAELNIPDHALVLMGCGHGDFRKGIDIFVRLGMQLVKPDTEIYLIWAGRIDPSIESYVRADIENLGLKRNIILTGEIKQPFEYYLASDIFVLTSREDPLPSVVMEAFDAGLPVIGFEGAGGFSDLFDSNAKGRLVPYLDERAMLEAVVEIHGELLAGKNYEHNHEYARKNFDYVAYLKSLLNPAQAENSRLQITGITEALGVTVIVPNYNYKRYLGGRLKSVLNQTYPIQELIFLDDCSGDGSVDFATEYLESSEVPFRVIANTENSGLVASQWKRGIDLANSEFVWIAEADDYCEPLLLQELARMANDYKQFTPVICYCDSWMVDSNGKIGDSYLDYHLQIEEIFGSIFRSSFVLGGEDFIFNALGVTNAIPNASACLLSRQALLQLDWDELLKFRLSSDWITYIRLMKYGAVAYSSKRLNYHRRHLKSVINQNLQYPVELANEAKLIHAEALRAIKDQDRVDALAQRARQWSNRAFGH